jgi:site-specific recombinase XerC
MTAPAECRICGVGHNRECRTLARYLDSLTAAGRAGKTIYERKRSVIRMAAAVEPPLVDATARDIQRWRLSLTVTQSAVADYTIAARRFFAWLVDEGLRDDNPAAKLPAPRRPKRLPRPIPEEELFYAIMTAPPRIRPWLVLASFCGLRACEISALRAENIRATGPQPSLLVTIEGSKGSRVERLVPLCQFVLDEIPGWRLPRTGFAFVRYDGRYWLPNSPQKISQKANEWLHASGTSYTLHSLRHRFATGVYAVDHDLLALAELLGHADVTTTQVYAKANPLRAREYVAGLPTPPRRLRAQP